MDGGQILWIYSGIADLTRRMLAAARDGEWDALIALEQARDVQFARLTACDDGAPRDATYRSEKAALIRGVLDDAAEIRGLVEPWQAQLLTMLGSTEQQRRLHETYATRA